MVLQVESGFVSLGQVVSPIVSHFRPIHCISVLAHTIHLCQWPMHGTQLGRALSFSDFPHGRRCDFVQVFKHGTVTILPFLFLIEIFVVAALASSGMLSGDVFGHFPQVIINHSVTLLFQIHQAACLDRIGQEVRPPTGMPF